MFASYQRTNSIFAGRGERPPADLENNPQRSQCERERTECKVHFSDNEIAGELGQAGPVLHQCIDPMSAVEGGGLGGARRSLVEAVKVGARRFWRRGCRRVRMRCNLPVYTQGPVASAGKPSRTFEQMGTYTVTSNRHICRRT